MKRRMIVCITLAAILLAVGVSYWAFCHLPHLTGAAIKNADAYILDAQYMNGTDGHTMTLNAGDVLAIRFETEKGTLHLEIKTPDGGVLYSGNGQDATDFTVNIAKSGSYVVTVKARFATGSIHIQAESQ